MNITEETIKMKSENNQEPEWMTKIRLEAWKKFNEFTISPKNEEWRYTDLSGLNLDNIRFELKFSEIERENKNIIFSDLKTALEDNEDIVKKYFSKIVEPTDKLTALNIALWNNGVFLYVPNKTVLEKSIRLSYIFDDQDTFVHNLIILDDDSELTIFESFNQQPKSKNISSNISEVIVGNNSKLNYNSFQDLSKESYEFSTKKCILKKNSEIDWNFGYFGGKLSRLKIETVFKGEGSKSRNIGVFFAADKQHFNITTNAIHLAKGTTNDILAKGVLKDESSSVYFGLINIDKNAQKTDSYLADHTLILSEGALANSIPSLKIDANDVRATHGATVSQIDEDQIFYLMSRGLSRSEAEMMIIQGFFEPVVEKIKMEDIKQQIQKIVQERMINA